MKTAILVDGGFYRKRAAALWGVRSAKERAKELIAYCQAHIKNQGAELYRVFYYDWAPIKNNLSEHVDGIHSCWNKKNGLGTKAAG